MKHNDAGLTIVEVLVAVFITSLLGLGVSSTFGASISSIGKSQSTSFTASGNSTMNAAITRDVELSNGFIIPNTSVVDSVTNAVGDGATVTYTYSGHNVLATGQSISITGMQPTGYNVSNAQVTSTPTATTFTVSNATTGSVVRGGSLIPICSTWNTTDTGYVSARPLITLSVQESAPVTSATGTGTVATYSYSGNAKIVAGQSITISGLVPATYNTIGAVVQSVNSVAKTFTLINSGSGTTSTNGVALFNSYIGYDVRTTGSSAALWRIQCPWPQVAVTGANSQVLRSDLPVSGDSSWTTSVKCSAFSAGSVALSTCPTNVMFTSGSSYSGISFTVPATVASATTQYPVQVVLAARSIS